MLFRGRLIFCLYPDDGEEGPVTHCCNSGMCPMKLMNEIGEIDAENGVRRGYVQIVFGFCNIDKTE